MSTFGISNDNTVHKLTLILIMALDHLINPIHINYISNQWP